MEVRLTNISQLGVTLKRFGLGDLWNVFDVLLGRGLPIRDVLGKSRMILGLLEGIPTMHKGEIAMVRLLECFSIFCIFQSCFSLLGFVVDFF